MNQVSSRTGKSTNMGAFLVTGVALLVCFSGEDIVFVEGSRASSNVVSDLYLWYETGDWQVTLKAFSALFIILLVQKYSAGVSSFLAIRFPPPSTLFPYTTLFR